MYLWKLNGVLLKVNFGHEKRNEIHITLNLEMQNTREVWKRQHHSQLNEKENDHREIEKIIIEKNTNVHGHK